MGRGSRDDARIVLGSRKVMQLGGRYWVSWRDVDVLAMFGWPHVWTPEVEEEIFPSRVPVSRNRVLGSRLQRLVG